MDDYNVSNLYESRNEYSARLVNILCPLIKEGLNSIFAESWNMCITNNEVNKYLMTFQNLLCRVPKWNGNIIEEERKRIIERSGCNYLEDLIACVHIIQLKVLTSIRVGNRQKKIDITIPKLDNFLHKVYIQVARKVYSNVYLFEKNMNPLQQQKNNRELEIIVQECILNAVRESIPVETIIRAYLDESVEQEEEVIIENIEEPILDRDNSSEEPQLEEHDEGIPKNPEQDIPDIVPAIQNIDNEPVITRLSFNDTDYVLDESDRESEINKPKTVDELEKLSMERTIQRRFEEDGDSGNERIQITNDSLELLDFDSLDGEKASEKVSLGDPLLDFEELI